MLLDGPAPTGGALVTLGVDLGIATIPSSVTIPAGSTSASFTITTSVVPSKVTVTVTASYQGTVTQSLIVTPVPTVATPIITAFDARGSVLSGGRFLGTLTVTLQCVTPGAVIHYTLDGTTPTADSPVYSTALTSTQTVTVKAIAILGGASSAVASGTFILDIGPSIAITVPKDGTQVRAGSSLQLTAAATDSDGTIVKVEFFQDGVKIGEQTSLPYTQSVASLAAGTYAFTAKATDSNGAQATSVPVQVTATLTGVTSTGIDCGQSITGTLDSTDGFSPIRGTGNYYADHYTLSGVAGHSLVLTVTSSDFDTDLILIGPGGTIVAQNDDSNGSSNSQVTYTIPAGGDGTYTVEVTSSVPLARGAYTLLLTCSSGAPTPQMQVTRDLDGTLVPSGSVFDFGSTPVGTPLSRSLTITNTGTADLILTNLSSSNTAFSFAAFPSSPVPAGGQTHFTLLFSAATAGGQVGSIGIVNNSATSPYTLTLAARAGAPITVTSFTVSPTTVPGGTSVQGTITLSDVAPPGGTTVTLTSAKPGIVAVPASVIVAQGQSTLTFSLPTTIIATAVDVPLIATLGSSQQIATLHVTPVGTPPTVVLTAPTDATTYPPGTSTVTLTATAAAQTPGATIAKVGFFNGSVKIGEATTAPYGFVWTSAPAGDTTLHAVATDSNGLTGRSADVTIHIAAAPSVATPTITAKDFAGNSVFSGGTANGALRVSITDQEPGVTLFYTLDGTLPTPLSPLYSGPFVLPPSGTPITVKARAYKTGFTASDPASATFTITPVSGLTRPSVSITSPGDGSEITGVSASSAVGKTSIIGSVTSTALAYWTLEYQSVGDSNWVPFAQGTNPVNNATIGYLDTTLMLDGQYDIRLTAVDQAGQSADPAIITIVIKGHQKIGYFTVSFTDMTIPIAGIPISITRTYDSRDKSNGDFGVGWTLSTTNAKVQKRQVSGYNWNQVRQGGGFSQAYYLQPARPHLITITLPGDTVYSFQETVSPEGQSFYPLDSTTVVYQQISGPKATLNPVGVDPNVYVSTPSFDDDPNASSTAVELYDGSNPDQIYNPTEFVLTMHNGSKFDVSQANGLQTITDRNGNVVTFSYNGTGCIGISSQDGRSIAINHSGINGTISSITGPSGDPTRYMTDGFGNLASYTDRIGNISTYEYDYQHNLTGIRDASGIMPMRNYYKPDGRLDYSLDAHDNRISYDYAANLGDGGSQPTNTERTIDRMGHPIDTTYDNFGNVTSKTQYLVNFDNTTTPITYHYMFGDIANPSKPTRITDPLGHNIDYNYDLYGNPMQVTQYLSNPDGTTRPIQIKIERGGSGEPLSLIDPFGVAVVKNTYGENGAPSATADPLGNVTHFTYNQDGSLATISDPLGNTSYYKYDTDGNVNRVIDSMGNSTYLGHDANGKITSRSIVRTNALGQAETLSTHYIYDADERLIQIIAPDGATTNKGYDVRGQLDHVTDALNRTTRYIYDDLGNCTETIYPDNTTTKKSYDANGNQITSTDKLGNTNFVVYDSLSRPVKSGLTNQQGTILTDANNIPLITTTTYNIVGQIIQEADPYGHVEKFVYDDLGRKIQELNPVGSVTTREYSDNGYLTKVIDANGNAISYDYDTDGRIIATHYPNGSISEITFDGIGRHTSVTDQSGLTTAYGYDALGRLVSVITPGGRVEQYGYDEIGNRTWQKDANGHTTRFAYDLQNRLISKILPDERGDSYSYNIDGTLSSHTDFNGISTFFNYDIASGRLINKKDANGNILISYTYDAKGVKTSELRNSVSGPVSTAYIYYPTDDFRQGNLQSVTTISAGNSETVTYDYDGLGHKISVQTPSMGAAKLNYAYDAAGRLIIITHPEGTTTTYTYDKVGNQSSIRLSNGFITSYAYDTQNRLNDLVNKDASGSVISAYHYTLLLNGKRASVTETGSAVGASAGTTYYVYDNNGQLTQESGLYGKVDYSYDAVGNRLKKTVSGAATGNGVTVYSYDVDDHIETESGPSGNLVHRYDANGNELLVNGQTASYDFENRLTTLSGGTTYTYDAVGNRIAVTINGITTRFVVDNSVNFAVVLEEYTNGNLAARYDYGNSLLCMVRDGNKYHYLFDGTGSTRQLVLNNGVVTDTYAYDAFGICLSHTGNSANTYMFGAQQYDYSSGTYYLRARYYNQNNGRFLSQDPYSGSNQDPITLHRYLYSGNDPVNNSDPGGQDFTLSGVTTSIAMSALIGGLSGGVISGVKAFIFGDGSYASVASAAQNGFVQGVQAGAYCGIPGIGSLFMIYYTWQAGAGIGEEVNEGKFGEAGFDALTLFGSLGLARYAETLGPCGARECFVAGTQIQMANGKTKAIDHIKVGDLVYSRDPKTGKTEVERVLRVFVHQVTTVVKISLCEPLHGRIIQQVIATPGHPFFVQGKGFVKAGQLGIGNVITCRAGPPLIVKSVEYLHDKSGYKVYNFEVSKDHTYFVGAIRGGLWVHNTCLDANAFEEVVVTDRGSGYDHTNAVKLTGPGVPEGGQWFYQLRDEYATQMGKEITDILEAKVKLSYVGEPGWEASLDEAVSGNIGGKLLYIVDFYGNMRICANPNGLHHGGLYANPPNTGAAPVQAAGELIIRGGNGSYNIQEINVNSGHFRPYPGAEQIAADILGRYGVH